MIETKIANEGNHSYEKVGLSTEATKLVDHLNQMRGVPQYTDIGPTSILEPRYPGERSPLALRDYIVRFPPQLIQAYILACETYDKAFMHVVGEHSDWETDYQHAPHTFAFQVDGLAWPDCFLQEGHIDHIDPQVLAEVIYAQTFEFENNIAGYNLNKRLWPDGTTLGTWQQTLEAIRKKTGKKIAVLAGTQKKLNEMIQSELGIPSPDNYLSEDEVRNITGFDALWGPNELAGHYNLYDGQHSDYVFYGRTSQPLEWLKNPDTEVQHVFDDYNLTAYTRAYALTHNFDNPAIPTTDPLNDTRVITDSKEALVKLGFAYKITQLEDIYSPVFLQYLSTESDRSGGNISIDRIINGTLTPKQKNTLGTIMTKFFAQDPHNPHNGCKKLVPSLDFLSETLISHLEARGTNPDLIANGIQKVRLKPLKRHYGVYGHLTGSFQSVKFLDALMKEITDRGQYILQPELSNLEIVDSNNATESYKAIDRIFLVRGEDGMLRFMESVRSLMPVNSPDGKKNSVHEGPYTRCARIVV